MKKNIKAVLFDYDGVIVNPKRNIDAWVKACEVYNFKILPKDWYCLEGLKPIEIATVFLKNNGVNEILAPKLVGEKEKQYDEDIKNNGNKIEVYKGVNEIFEYLRNEKIKLGLVTGSILKRVRESIPDLVSYFDIIVTADSKNIDGEPIKGKPNPDPWLFAAKKLILEPDNCVGVENAILGVKSVVAAGMTCLALGTTMDNETLNNAGADLFYENHSDLLYFLKNLIENDK